MKIFAVASLLAIGACASRQNAPPTCTAKCGSEIGFTSLQGPELVMSYDGKTLTVPQHCREEDCTAHATAIAAMQSEVSEGFSKYGSLQSAVDSLSSYATSHTLENAENIETLRNFAQGQANENAALRKLVSALSSTIEGVRHQVQELESNLADDVKKLTTKLEGDVADLAELDEAYQKADDELAVAIGAVSKMQGPKGDTGPRGPRGITATNYPTPIPITAIPTPQPTPQPTLYPTPNPTPAPPTPSPTPSEHLCAWEGGHCGGCHGKVWYGSGNRVAQIKSHGRYATRHSSGGIGCHNGVFGDPWGGRRKNCICEGN